MKIRLYVNGEQFVIEECEGAPEIRREGYAKSTADTSLNAYPFDDEPTAGESPRARMSVHLKVEAAS